VPQPWRLRTGVSALQGRCPQDEPGDGVALPGVRDGAAVNVDPDNTTVPADPNAGGKPLGVRLEAELYELICEGIRAGMGTREARRWALRKLRRRLRS
jgi:hypothetical protein